MARRKHTRRSTKADRPGGCSRDSKYKRTKGRAGPRCFRSAKAAKSSIAKLGGTLRKRGTYGGFTRILRHGRLSKKRS